MKSFNVMEFGAAADSDELQTQRLQAAIDKCFIEGGGEVVIPKGDYIVAGIRLRSRVTLI